MSSITRQFVMQGLQSPLLLFCHLVTVALALVLIVILSRYERRLVSRQLGNGLLCLRLSVLAVILLTLLQPTISWTLEETHVGRILVGIDLSDSMSTMDVHGSRGEKLRVARGLELIGNPNFDDRLNRWQLAFDAGQEPEWIGADETHEETRRKALEESRRENLGAIFRQVEKLPRSEIARRLISATKAPLLDQLGQSGRIELFAFAGKAESLQRDQLIEFVAKPPASLQTHTTNLSVSLRTGTVSTTEIMGIVLLTDGRDHGEQNLAAMAATLKEAQIPVYPILIGSQFRPKDLSILLLEHPETVYKGDHPQLKVTISTVGFEGKTIDVELLREDLPEAKPIRQSVVCKGNSAIVEFELDADEIGRKTYLVRTPVQTGETREDNNSRSFSVTVVDDRAKVFIVDGEARWEFRYLDVALSRDERVDLKTVLFDQPFIGVLPEPFFPRQLALPANPTDLAASPFAESDLVIVGDVSPEHFTEAAWQTLLKFVSEGGTLVLSAGKRYLPQAHHSPALEQLLPVIAPKPVSLGDASQEVSPSSRGLPITLTVDGEQQPMLQFAPEMAHNIAIWKGLPGQTWALLGNAKPNATVWATTQIPEGRVESLPADRKFGVFVHQFIGRGQVVWLGIDATWRWRYRVGDKYHHRFWAQMARWAAANKMSAGTEFVRFGPETVEIERGQDARFRARWTPAFLQKFPNLKSHVEFYRQGDDGKLPFTSIDLVPAKGLPLQHEGRALALPAGEYQVRLVADNATLGDKRIESTLLVAEKPSAELTDLSTNRELLTQIADTSGGRLFLPDEVHELPKLFKKGNETITQYKELTLWDRWPSMMLLFSLLMCEWVTRKLKGLP